MTVAFNMSSVAVMKVRRRWHWNLALSSGRNCSTNKIAGKRMARLQFTIDLSHTCCDLLGHILSYRHIYIIYSHCYTRLTSEYNDGQATLNAAQRCSLLPHKSQLSHRHQACLSRIGNLPYMWARPSDHLQDCGHTCTISDKG